MEVDDIITDKLIENVWGNADFGEILNKNKRKVIDNAILKIAAGYSNGHTANCILQELGLISFKDMELTKNGKRYLYATFVRDKNF